MSHTAHQQLTSPSGACFSLPKPRTCRICTWLDEGAEGVKGERAGRSAPVFFSMIEEGVACHDVDKPCGFYLIKNIIPRWEIRVVQDTHGGGVKLTGLIQPFDQIDLYRALWGWLHSMTDTSQRDFVTAHMFRLGLFRWTTPLLESRRRVFSPERQ